MTRSEAITALYALFNAPHNADINLVGLNVLLDELYLSPQPDIAPYAWVTFTPYGDEDDVWYENPEGQLLEGWTYKPLYDTTPPQRTWAGLTNGEMIELSEMKLGGWDLILEVEDKLRSKNT